MTNENEHAALIERLRLAQQIVDRAQLHDSLRPAGFTEAFRALSGQHTDGEKHFVEVGDHDDPSTGHGQRRPNVSGISERLAAVAQAFSVDPSVVDQLFAEDEDELLFVLPSRRLTNTTRGAMRQIAILTACARQAGGWDGAWTTSVTLRAACERAGVYSSKHFNTVVRSLDMFAVQGAGNTCQLRAHAASYAAAKSVLIELGLLNEEVSS